DREPPPARLDSVQWHGDPVASGARRFGGLTTFRAGPSEAGLDLVAVVRAGDLHGRTRRCPPDLVDGDVRGRMIAGHLEHQPAAHIGPHNEDPWRWPGGYVRLRHRPLAVRQPDPPGDALIA